jgi:hypothetical protein
MTTRMLDPFWAPSGVDLIGRRPWPVAQLRPFLAGAWSIRRSIIDRQLGISGTYTGVAEFTAFKDDLRYRELGELSFGSYRGVAHRDLLFALQNDGCAEVLFHDGRPFHTLDLRNGTDRVTHLCGSDAYYGCFEATDPESLCVDWVIKGPRKNQQLSTCYTRFAPF